MPGDLCASTSTFSLQLECNQTRDRLMYLPTLLADTAEMQTDIVSFTTELIT